MRHSCKKKRKHPVENDQQSMTKLLSEENNKPQDLTVRAGYSVIFSGKLGATPIQSDSAAYTVSTCSLTMEVDAVTV